MTERNSLPCETHRGCRYTEELGMSQVPTAERPCHTAQWFLRAVLEEDPLPNKCPSQQLNESNSDVRDYAAMRRSRLEEAI